MIDYLLVAVIVLAIVQLGVIVFIWWQLNDTGSRLVRLIEGRFRLNNLTIELDKLQSIDDLKEDEF
ncbi:MAG: hypothetical protein U1C51_05645 [Candidatus Izemoplasmatales bacterium]|nr:hypothetical protein [Candidatus Izemoplasmatales bacterium]